MKFVYIYIYIEREGGGAIEYELSWKKTDVLSQVQIMDKVDCISLCANALGEDIYPSFLPLPLAQGKIV